MIHMLYLLFVEVEFQIGGHLPLFILLRLSNGSQIAFRRSCLISGSCS